MMQGERMMHGGMMQRMRGMHQQMMQSPMHRTSMMAFMLPALADTLGLSDQQKSRLQEMKSEVTAQRQEHRQQMMSERQEFMSLFDDDGSPSTDAVRQHLMTMAEERANQQAALYETAQQMRQVLTDEQRQVLDDMSPQQRMHQMMSRMPMMDMMEMMRTMHGGMMGGGMMQPGSMMKQGGMKNRPGQQSRQNQ